jgi:peptidyl-dipeptidase A
VADLSSLSPAELVADLEAQVRPLEVELAEAWWQSNTESSPAADERRIAAELARREFLADPARFAAVRAAREAVSADTDPLLRRQLDVLHDGFVPHQVPADLRRAIVELETRVESTFNNFRGQIDGRRVDDNTIAEILRTSDDSAERRAAWEASKQIGPEVAERIRELARLRNQAAQALGARDHFALALATGELDEDRLFATLDDVDRATAAPFTEWKHEVDERLAARFAVTIADLRPWHYDDPFFQNPPAEGAVSIDHLFTDADLEALTVRTYDGLGLDVRSVLGHSDLYAREGKSQHAFCIDIDRAGDVRVLCNVEPSERWMDTMLHEFGHAIYDRECDRSLPWLVRGAAHALTTEGIAMLMGRLPREPAWLRQVAAVDDTVVDEIAGALAEARRAALLVFARWVLVMTNFERSLYADPDADLDTLWWDLVEHHQLVRRPDGRHAPDWAAKIHLAAAPVYYQNYLYGELFASQLDATLRDRAGGIVDRAAAGALLRDEVFAPGASLRWDALVERATGASLSAEHMARQLGRDGL